MTGKPWQNEARLRELYCARDMTQSEIAGQLGCSVGTISNWLDKFGIETERYDPAKSGPWRDKEALEQAYVEQGKGRDELAEEWGTTRRTINRWLRRHGIASGRQPDPYGYLVMSGNGYVHFVDYYDTNKERRVAIHRLTALVDVPLDGLKGKHVHHKNNTQWLNYPANLEVLTPKQHQNHHHLNDTKS